jgi:hypothetical protein
MLGARGAAVDPRGAGRGRGLPRPGFGSAAQKKSSLKPLHWVKVTRALQGSLWDELQRHGESQTYWTNFIFAFLFLLSSFSCTFVYQGTNYVLLGFY